MLLWGFMASGKTAVGSRLAARLGWEHVDLDAVIVRRAGKPIAEIFRQEGEAAFRALEMAVSRDHLARTKSVISPGGGWITNEGVLDQLPSGTLTVWLRVTPDTVLKRLRRGRGAPTRPLLADPDPAQRVRTLLAQREPLYRRAARIVETDGRSVASVVAEIAAFVQPPLSASQRRPEISDG